MKFNFAALRRNSLRCLTRTHTTTCELGDAFLTKNPAGGSMPITLIEYDGRRIEYLLGLAGLRSNWISRCLD